MLIIAVLDSPSKDQRMIQVKTKRYVKTYHQLTADSIQILRIEKKKTSSTWLTRTNDFFEIEKNGKLKRILMDERREFDRENYKIIRRPNFKKRMTEIIILQKTEEEKAEEMRKKAGLAFRFARRSYFMEKHPVLLPDIELTPEVIPRKSTVFWNKLKYTLEIFSDEVRRYDTGLAKRMSPRKRRAIYRTIWILVGTMALLPFVLLLILNFITHFMGL